MTTLLRGAQLVDGTGAAARAGDVLIDDGRIIEIREPGTEAPTGADIVELDGLTLAPGFIDPHTHYDAQVLWDPDLTPSCWHGVTTVVMGNCGFGLAPVRPEDRGTIMRVLENVEGMPLDALEEGIPWTFETYPEYLDAIDALPLRVNVASLIGHTPLRFYVMGDDATEREATDAEIAQMRALVDEALVAGAAGFSTSRSPSHTGAYGKPVPSRACSVDEIREIARALGTAGHGTVEATWGPDLHVDEFAEIAEDIGRPVSWAAIMTSNRDPSHATDTVARTAAKGGDVHPQISCRPIVVEIALSDPAPFANVPAFGDVLSAARTDRAAVYAAPGWSEKAKPQLAELWGDIFSSAVVASSASQPDLIDGPTLGELAAERGQDPFDVMLELALAENLETRFRVAMTNDNEPQIAEMLANPRLLLGLSDAGAHTSQLCDANYATHLLGYWCREKKVLTLEDAVRRLTADPAAVYGIADRGVIEPGAVADLVAFDPATVGTTGLERLEDLPGNASRLVARGIGIEHIWVAGLPIRRDGVDLDNVGAGELLRFGL